MNFMLVRCKFQDSKGVVESAWRTQHGRSHGPSFMFHFTKCWFFTHGLLSQFHDFLGCSYSPRTVRPSQEYRIHQGNLIILDRNCRWPDFSLSSAVLPKQKASRTTRKAKRKHFPVDNRCAHRNSIHGHTCGTTTGIKTLLCSFYIISVFVLVPCSLKPAERHTANVNNNEEMYSE